MYLKSLFKKSDKNDIPKTVLFDYIQKDKKFLDSYKKYKVQTDIVNRVNSILDSGKMVIVSAYWCPDCRNNVPKMAKISEELSNWSFKIMDRDDEGVKERYTIKKIPTFIIYDNCGNEFGRIIENPTSGSLEQDLLNIVTITN